jgi:serine/threonine-protein kinase
MTVALAVIAAAAYYLLVVKRTSGIDSLAVLPFINASSDPNLEYLSDGIAETLINDLSQLPKLRVTARSTAFHYKNRDLDPEQVGRELHVKAVLTGRVVERAGNLRIQVDLLDAVNGSELWGRQYSERVSDILVVQGEIARQISEKLRLKLSGDDQKRLAKHSTENTEAYQLYLKGLYHWNRRSADDLKKGVDDFEQAIALDPTYGLAYAGLAGCYNVMSQYAGRPAKKVFPKAEEAARHAIQIDDGIAQAHAFLGYARFAYDWDWAGAERELRRAIDLDPNFVTAHSYYSVYLVAIGRTEQAIAEAHRAQELDPLSLITHATAGLVLTHARLHDEAIAQCRRALDFDPNFAAGHWFLGMAYMAQGNQNAAIEELQKAVDLGGGNSQYSGSLAAALAAGGRTAEARKSIPPLLSMGGDSAISYQLALIYENLGDKDRAMDFLEKAYDEHAFQMCMAKSQPYLDPLRSHPRFVALMQRLNFP